MLALKRGDYEFILSVSKFCNKIEWYIDLLQLNTEILHAFKSHNTVLNHIIGNNELWDVELRGFFAVTLENLKMVYHYLTFLCTCSPNYNTEVGLDLGIEMGDLEFEFSEN